MPHSPAGGLRASKFTELTKGSATVRSLPVSSIVRILTVRSSSPGVLEQRKAAFLNRRKTLINSLAGNTAFDRDTLTSALTKAGIDPGIRGERLTGEEFAEIADCLTAKNNK